MHHNSRVLLVYTKQKDCEAAMRLIPLLLRRLRLQHYVVLSVGRDPELLRLRSALLRSAGYNVRTEPDSALTTEVLENADFDLIILCHTIPDDDRWRLISDIRSCDQSMPILLLRANGETLLHPAELHSLDGPEALIEKVGKLLKAPQNQAVA